MRVGDIRISAASLGQMGKDASYSEPRVIYKVCGHLRLAMKSSTVSAAS